MERGNLKQKILLGTIPSNQQKQQKPKTMKTKTKTTTKKDYSKEIKSHASSKETFTVDGKECSYGLGGEGITKAFKETTLCNQKLAIIPKKYLGIDKSYQRTASKRQIQNIAKKFDMANFDVPAVYKIKHNNKFYYQIVDGQHRCCANQQEEILCRIVNTKAAVTRCLEANDASRKRSWSINDMFWGKIVELDRCPEIRDEEHRKTIIEFFLDAGFTPCNPANNKPVDVGCRIASIHNHWIKNTWANLESLQMRREEKEKKALKILKDVIDIVKEVFPKMNYQKWGGTVWAGLFDLLSDNNRNSGMSNYDKKQIIAALQYGRVTTTGNQLSSRINLTDFASYNFASQQGSFRSSRRHDSHVKVLKNAIETYAKFG